MNLNQSMIVEELKDTIVENPDRTSLDDANNNIAYLGYFTKAVSVSQVNDAAVSIRYKGTNELRNKIINFLSQLTAEEAKKIFDLTTTDTPVVNATTKRGK